MASMSSAIFVNHYKVLGLEFGADEKTISRAYKKLALKLHPDKKAPDKKKIPLDAV